MIEPAAPRVAHATESLATPIVGATARRRELFCVAGALSGEDDLATRLSRAFRAAREFLNAHSAAGVVRAALEGRAHRDAVIAALDPDLHVGFMSPNEPDAGEAIAAAATRAGFAHRHARFASAVIALELGELTGKSSVTTTILKAHSAEPALAARAIEAFVPLEDSATVNEWIDQGIGTHVGLKVASPAAIPEVVQAFLAEGYRLPSFMRGGTIANPTEGSIVAYVEKVSAATALRIELFSKAERSE